jgi:hypothetical protein
LGVRGGLQQRVNCTITDSAMSEPIKSKVFLSARPDGRTFDLTPEGAPVTWIHPRGDSDATGSNTPDPCSQDLVVVAHSAPEPPSTKAGNLPWKPHPFKIRTPTFWSVSEDLAKNKKREAVAGTIGLAALVFSMVVSGGRLLLAFPIFIVSFSALNAAHLWLRGEEQFKSFADCAIETVTMGVFFAFLILSNCGAIIVMSAVGTREWPLAIPVVVLTLGCLWLGWKTGAWSGRVTERLIAWIGTRVARSKHPPEKDHC